MDDYSVTAIILARNEESRIKTCLDSLSWVDERIVIDNNSTDNTAKYAKESGAVVITGDGQNFSRLRDLGKKHAHGAWLLYIDADEVASSSMHQEIHTAIQANAFDAYNIPRTNFYLGHRWPAREYLARLFRRSALMGWYGELHESPRFHGEVGVISSQIVHHTHRTLEEMVKKTNEWSTVEARLRLTARHPLVVWWRFIRVMGTGFFYSYGSQGGWKAGVMGYIESMYQSFSYFITYAKLWEMQTEA